MLKQFKYATKLKYTIAIVKRDEMTYFRILIILNMGTKA